MKRLSVICLFALYLVSATEARQLLKLPVLFEHYAEHTRLNPEMSFADFMCMHYAGYHPDDGDQDRDMQLPFKTPSSVAFDMASFASASSVMIAKPAVSIKAHSFTTEDYHLPSAYQSTVWQPPKAC